MLNKGDRVGQLILISKEKRGTKTFWLCKCDCGKEKWIRSDNLLKKSPTRSCGCLAEKTQLKRIDISGRKYGRLTVLSFTGEGTGEDEIWICRCNCGNEISLSKSKLYEGHVTSCGCLAQESRLINSEKAQEKLRESDWVQGTSISKISSKKIIRSNTSGITGVSWDKTRSKWVAQIVFKNKHYSLGRYEIKDDAIRARKEAEEKLFVNFLKWYEEKYKK